MIAVFLPLPPFGMSVFIEVSLFLLHHYMLVVVGRRVKNKVSIHYTGIQIESIHA